MAAQELAFPAETPTLSICNRTKRSHFFHSKRLNYKFRKSWLLFAFQMPNAYFKICICQWGTSFSFLTFECVMFSLHMFSWSYFFFLFCVLLLLNFFQTLIYCGFLTCCCIETFYRAFYTSKLLNVTYPWKREFKQFLSSIKVRWTSLEMKDFDGIGFNMNNHKVKTCRKSNNSFFFFSFFFCW